MAMMKMMRMLAVIPILLSRIVQSFFLPPINPPITLGFKSALSPGKYSFLAGLRTTSSSLVVVLQQGKGGGGKGGQANNNKGGAGGGSKGGGGKPKQAGGGAGGKGSKAKSGGKVLAKGNLGCLYYA